MSHGNGTSMTGLTVGIYYHRPPLLFLLLFLLCIPPPLPHPCPTHPSQLYLPHSLHARKRKTMPQFSPGSTVLQVRTYAHTYAHTCLLTVSILIAHYTLNNPVTTVACPPPLVCSAGLSQMCEGKYKMAAHHFLQARMEHCDLPDVSPQTLPPQVTCSVSSLSGSPIHCVCYVWVRTGVRCYVLVQAYAVVMFPCCVSIPRMFYGISLRKRSL